MRNSVPFLWICCTRKGSIGDTLATAGQLGGWQAAAPAI
jgi:hypothetical protein